MLRYTEKDNLGLLIKQPVTKEMEHQLAIIFVEDNDFVSDGNNCKGKMVKTLKKYSQPCEAAAGRLHFEKKLFFQLEIEEKKWKI